MDPAPLLNDIFNHLADFASNADIGLIRRSFSTGRFYILCNLHSSVQINIINDNPGIRSSQCFGNRLSNPSTGARHDGHFSIQIDVQRIHLFFKKDLIRYSYSDV